MYYGGRLPFRILAIYLLVGVLFTLYTLLYIPVIHSQAAVGDDCVLRPAHAPHWSASVATTSYERGCITCVTHAQMVARSGRWESAPRADIIVRVRTSMIAGPSPQCNC